VLLQRFAFLVELIITIWIISTIGEMTPFTTYTWAIISIPTSSTIRKIAYLATDSKLFMKKFITSTLLY